MAKIRRVDYFAEVTLENIDDLFKLNSAFLNRFVFRGQANCNWNLSTSLERLIEEYHGKDDIQCPQTAEIYERQMLREFQHIYPLYNNYHFPPENDLVEWLSIMQHYGAKTRLLDFTDSFFVALFMALENSKEDVSIWGLNNDYINGRISRWYTRENGPGCVTFTEISKFIKIKANEIIRCNLKLEYPEILIIRPDYVNERIVRQQGLFLMPSDIERSFSDCLNDILLSDPTMRGTISWNKFLNSIIDTSPTTSNPNLILFNLRIPHTFKYELVRMLNQMNVTAETLFPGLEGFCKSLNHMRSKKTSFR